MRNVRLTEAQEAGKHRIGGALARRRAYRHACRIAAGIFFALVIAGVGTPGAPRVHAEQDPAQTLSQELARLNEQLSRDQNKLAELNNRVQSAQADLVALNSKLAADQLREKQLDQELADLARSQYERPPGTLSNVLDARGADQVLSDVAQSRLIAAKQRDLLAQAADLREQDEHARSLQATRLVEIQNVRDDAASVAARTLATRDAVNDAVTRARAQSVADQAKATQAAANQPVISLQGEASVSNHFPGGWCTWYVASRRNVPWWGDAIDWWANARPYGYAEGQTPAVGAIMVTRESIEYGHVAFVESVNSDGSWTVSEMNFVGWNIQSTRTIRPGQVPVVGFIYGRSA